MPSADTDAALASLATHGGRAKVLAGGQSLLPMLNLRLVSPETRSLLGTSSRNSPSRFASSADAIQLIPVTLP
jgi:hypothetical protein